MSYLSEALELLLSVLQAVLAYVLGYAKQHPVVTSLAVLALLRLFGITVQTGHRESCLSSAGCARS